MQFSPPPPAPTAARKRGMKIGKKLQKINAEFGSLPREHKKATVYYAMGRCAGITDEKLRAAAGPAIALIEGAS